jgi:hypothetical protein
MVAMTSGTTGGMPQEEIVRRDYSLDVAWTCTSTTWANVVVIAEKRISVTPPFRKFMAWPISRAG